MQKLELLAARSNVSTRASETAVSLGFLFMAVWEPLGPPSAESPTIAMTSVDEMSSSSSAGADEEQKCIPVLIGFVAKKDIVKGELQIFRDAAARTRNAAKGISSPTATRRHLCVSMTENTVIATLGEIAAFYVEPVLTLTPGGESACLVRLGIDLNRKPDAADADAFFMPDLWFERDEIGHDIVVKEVLEELTRWLSLVGKGLKTEKKNSGEESHQFTLVEGPGDALSPTGKSPTKEWPISLPFSQSSLVYKVGAFGFGVAAAIVGPSISNKVEE
ncbi:hypothetical protein HK101_008867 [Irineochytrium annulatum]|nr:hypothetical protein HK101_008867 [Irineochytrium annulatum]